MWNLRSIEAYNLCSFEHLKYCIEENCATLVFGNNMDDDSQNSNGSGKSALIEAIAIALTGETLRKVNMDEIINDRHDECRIVAALSDFEGVSMTITRVIPRKGAQSVRVEMNYRGEVEEQKEACVSDYNKRILDIIGVTKDEIYANFILTAKKYKSFLTSSDREKKEVINKFSNGVLVDEGIEALRQDMEPVEAELATAEKIVAENTGKVSAIDNEIEKAIAESNDRNANRKERIESWTRAIADKRSYIREQDEAIDGIEHKLDGLESIDKKLQEIEKTDQSISDKHVAIKAMFDTHDIVLETDYSQKIKDLRQQIDKYQADTEKYLKEEKDANQCYREARKSLEEAQICYNRQKADIDNRQDSAKERIARLSEEIHQIQETEDGLRLKRKTVVENISYLSTLLSGIITCPKCRHEFVLEDGVDVVKTREQLESKKSEEQEILQQIRDAQSKYEKKAEEGKVAREEMQKLDASSLNILKALQDTESAVTAAKQKYDYANEEVGFANASLLRTQRYLDTLHKDMFDEAFDTLDKAFAKCESDIKQFKLNISNAKGAIESYEESIKDAENAADTDIIGSLKKSKEIYDVALQQSIKRTEEVAGRYNGLKMQEARFMEFKTYLANIKIDAIGEITNSFLDTIGSDIRVKLSGYTLLKSGKIRDKISVSLIRGGIDCGSFEKFSKGEQTRVELASILAMHRLTNMNCETGKGLNLLVIDEILDAADEQGLANVFDALNKTHITSIVISHGQVRENYPHKLIINKQNGISFI